MTGSVVSFQGWAICLPVISFVFARAPAFLAWCGCAACYVFGGGIVTKCCYAAELQLCLLEAMMARFYRLQCEQRQWEAPPLICVIWISFGFCRAQLNEASELFEAMCVVKDAKASRFS